MNILLSTLERLSIPSAERTHVSEVATNLAKIGNNIHLIALDKGDLEFCSSIAFYKTFSMTTKPILERLGQKIQLIHTRFLINRIIMNKKIDVVYERHYEYDLGTLAGHKSEIPTVLEVNGIAPAEAELTGANDRLIGKLIEREVEQLSRADKVVAVGQDIKEYYARMGVPWDKIVVIPNGVNVDAFRPEDKGECRRHLEFGSHPVITFVGEFRPYHGIENAIKAMPYVVKAFPNAKLVIVGHNSKPHLVRKPTIESLRGLADEAGVSNNLILTGRVPSVPIYLNASDICIAPFIRERTAGGIVPDRTRDLKIFEYMACGKPIIATDTGSFARLIMDNSLGLVVEPDDPEALARGIIELLSDPMGIEEMGTRAREFVVKNFTWEKTALEIMKLLLELSERSNPLQGVRVQF